MLTRLPQFLFLAFVAGLLIACSGDQPPDVTAVELTQSSEPEQAQAQTSQTQTDTQPSDSAQPEAETQPVDQQPAEPALPSDDAADPSALDEQPPSDSQSNDPSWLQEPDFDIEIANRYLRHLVEALGSRASGTEEEAAAANYLAKTFQGMGYEVEIQLFRYTVQETFGRIDLDGGDSVFAFRFPGSSMSSVRGELVNVNGLGSEADFAAVNVSGKIAIVDRGELEFRAKGANALAAGATALVIANRRLSESVGGSLAGDTISIPVLHVSKESGDQLRTLLGSIVSIAETSPLSGTSQNVIARKTGGACRVVVGGHYDTVPQVDGANDNASGTALTLALAETWSEHPAATGICFVGFGAEEIGLKGSIAYVAGLVDTGQLTNVTAMLNLDAIGDGRAPYRIAASAELADLTNMVASQLQINASSGVLNSQFGSDHMSFSEQGVPYVFIFPVGGILHTPLDNLNNVDYQLFEDISRLKHGVLTCLLARAGSPINPSISCGLN